MTARLHKGSRGIVAVLAVLVAGCGGGGGGSSPAPVPRQAEVSGLLVVHREVQTGAGESLGPPPADWAPAPDRAAFDRALANADWELDGDTGLSGTTTADGRFVIKDLDAGRYTLVVTRTLDGNLVPVVVPVVAGDDGSGKVVTEIAWGLVRTTLEYTKDGVAYREIHGPNGTRVVLGGGRIVELAAPDRLLQDLDGDGRFDGSGSCVPRAWECGDDGSCENGLACDCVASCPDCRDCGPPVCAEPNSGIVYRCNDDGTCAGSGDRCVCVSSCPACDDCPRQVCVPGCGSVEIAAISITHAPRRLFVGQHAQATAAAVLSDGTTIDVTHLASWRSAVETVATVDSWGTVTGVGEGATELSATLGGLAAAAWTVTVTSRPAPLRLWIENRSCVYWLGRPEAAIGILPGPECRQVILVGGQIPFAALAEFDGGVIEDVTAEAEWQVDPAGVGDFSEGVFTARQVGTAQLTARLDAVSSEPTEIRVVAERSVLSLSIYPMNWYFPPGLPFPVTDARPVPCPDCQPVVTLLTGDTMPFRATAQYDTGEWEDVTERVTWQSTPATVATIDATGLLTAVSAGDAEVRATLGTITSAAADVRVVDTATLEHLTIFQEGINRVVEKGDRRYFRATGMYDIGLHRDVTAEATWKTSDASVATFTAPGELTAMGAGTVDVWAEIGAERSESLRIEVYETSALDYCDPQRIHHTTWSDAFNRVTLESDCATYTAPGVATLRYTVTEVVPRGGIFAPCLDLYVYRGATRVRTLREQGCGDPFIPNAAPGRDDEAVKYQLRAFWDLKDDSGIPVEPGRYTIHGRFYLYYDPVVSLDLVVSDASGRVACELNRCGNGCGYIHACGDGGAPLACPEVCRELCECPPGWGIVEGGQCVPCTQECCPPGAPCAAGMRPCDPPCCPVGSERCLPGLPACQPKGGCCPAGADCHSGLPPCDQCCKAGETCPDILPPCEPPPPVCCPPNARCTPDVPPCPATCCPPGASCIIDLPPCPA